VNSPIEKKIANPTLSRLSPCYNVHRSAFRVSPLNMNINNRLLIVDDDEAIHRDFKKILNPVRPSKLDKELSDIESTLFDSAEQRPRIADSVEYVIDHAYQGGEALALIEKATQEGRPYSLMFSDVRIPPGIDGITLVQKVRSLTPHTQVVIVTAFADYGWEEITEIFGWTDHLLILRKPVDPITVKQVALMLTRKWTSETALRGHRDQLEAMVTKRTEKLTSTNQLLTIEIADRERAEKALQDAHAELASTNKSLQFEIMQRKQTEEQQKVLLRDLETANKELENFAYVVSHDLKAPLRAIHSISSWLSEDFSHDLRPEAREYIRDMMEQTRWMHHLIEGILQYSRLGRVKSEMEALDSFQLVTKLVELLSPPEQIQVIVDRDLPRIIFDRTHLEQVFQNLIGNAVKHMNTPSGTITISCHDEDRYWRFKVADTGEGIAEKHFERIFKIFQTLHPLDEPGDSTGIGLSLVKKIVEHHGGSVHIASTLGQGSTFSFTVAKNLKVKPIAKDFTVLTIDDNKDFGGVATAMLKRAGYRALYASSGADALEIVANQSHPVHTILLDINLPGEAVAEVYSKLRATLPHAKIVACTGEQASNDIEMLRGMGIDGVLNKPFDLNELNEVLQLDVPQIGRIQA